MTFVRIYLLGIGLLFFSPYLQAIGCKGIGCLDFDTAVRRVLDQSLELNIASYSIKAREGEKKQAALYPNPEFYYEIDSPGATGTRANWVSREDRYTLTQLIELGGKRSNRIKVASYQYYASLIGYEASKLEQLNRLSKIFIDVVASQEMLQLVKEQNQLAQEMLQVATEKLEAGKVSLIQLNKAEITYTVAELNVEKAQAELIAARNHLALLWASTCPDFAFASYPFFEITAPPPLEELLADICQQPELIQSFFDHSAACHQLLLEKAARVPNVSLTLGYTRDEGIQGFVAGVSIPLPLFDLNQGNIQKAHAEVHKATDQSRQLWLILEAKLVNSYQKHLRYYQEAERLKFGVLKLASNMLELAKEGYKEGKLEYSEVQDAQQALFDIKQRYIQAIVNYHHSRADIDYLNSQTD